MVGKSLGPGSGDHGRACCTKDRWRQDATISSRRGGRKTLQPDFQSPGESFGLHRVQLRSLDGRPHDTLFPNGPADAEGRVSNPANPARFAEVGGGSATFSSFPPADRGQLELEHTDYHDIILHFWGWHARCRYKVVLRGEKTGDSGSQQTPACRMCQSSTGRFRR